MLALSSVVRLCCNRYTSSRWSEISSKPWKRSGLGTKVGTVRKSLSPKRSRKFPQYNDFKRVNGATRRDRTGDLLITNQRKFPTPKYLH